ncbi:UNVERIFIED_CONTAM: Zinc finger A20 and AN1 domain-containing stress-associated protein 5 [Sesamum radiatum]|uniref:Zinc finger A20 and AN1 domain-containing stress-associated protein 5 n=1 Tax=Sesamum radiatum TaxID=300843 RepID=A0AAW2W2H1_SESRA
MAQKRDKEETELKVPENLPICTPPQTLPSPHPQLPAARSPETSDPKHLGACDPRISSAASPDKPDLVAPMENRGGSLKRPREVTRCSGSGCRKRIGLMGFRCRCGDVFCSEHRYSDRHDCSYDYKAAGREAIARENPVVRAAKLLKV